MWRSIIGLCALTPGCAGAVSPTDDQSTAPPRSAPHVASRLDSLQTPPEPASKESPNCRAARLGILQSMNNSREESVCSRDQDCSTVTSPETRDDEAKLVVRAVDAAGLDAVAKRHLALCGATRGVFFSPDVFTVVEAKCVNARCEAVETTFHPQSLD